MITPEEQKPKFLDICCSITVANVSRKTDPLLLYPKNVRTRWLPLLVRADTP